MLHLQVSLLMRITQRYRHLSKVMMIVMGICHMWQGQAVEEQMRSRVNHSSGIRVDQTQHCNRNVAVSC